MPKAARPSPILLFLVGLLVPAWIRLVQWTTRWEMEGAEHFQAARDSTDGFIVAFWHSRIMMMVPVRERYPGRFFFMISAHRDGDLIAKGVEAFRIEFARGSARDARKKDKNKGGSGALKTLLDALKAGAGVGLTPDGPRGPAQKVQPGVLALARLSGKPVIPVAYATTNAKFMKSWDRFHLPLPFSRGYYVYGAPVAVPDGDEQALETARQTLESALNDVTARAETLAGREPTGHGQGEGSKRTADGK